MRPHEKQLQHHKQQKRNEREKRRTCQRSNKIVQLQASSYAACPSNTHNVEETSARDAVNLSTYICYEIDEL